MKSNIEIGDQLFCCLNYPPDLFVAALLDLLKEVLGDLAAVVGVDQAQRVQAAALRVPGAVRRVLK